jgi:hypothetical protein
MIVFAAALVAASFEVGYLAFSVPALIACVATNNIGLQPTALVYCGAVGTLLVAAIGILLAHPSAIATPVPGVQRGEQRTCSRHRQ